jgi:histidine triad (HIT) family protein
MCPFCERIAAGQFSPVTANSYAVVFEPLNPVVAGHLLVVSRRHIIDATSDPFTTAKVMELAATIARGWGDANIITSIGSAATQTVPHLHAHLVPRYDGDGLKLPWSDQL